MGEHKSVQTEIYFSLCLYYSWQKDEQTQASVCLYEILTPIIVAAMIRFWGFLHLY